MKYGIIDMEIISNTKLGDKVVLKTDINITKEEVLKRKILGVDTGYDIMELEDFIDKASCSKEIYMIAIVISSIGIFKYNEAVWINEQICSTAEKTNSSVVWDTVQLPRDSKEDFTTIKKFIANRYSGRVCVGSIQGTIEIDTEGR